MNEVVDKRKTVSRREILRLVVGVGVPGKQDGFVKGSRCRLEGKTVTAVRSLYFPTGKLGRENDDYGGERSRSRLCTEIALSGRIGRR